ncbi:MAG: hypothetical protein EXR76_15555 [Myxococcales bacterium]|nr:hypothetical protein [Myxococcales bacterium]
MTEKLEPSDLRELTVELKMADDAWREGNAGKARVCSRRAAGMGLKLLLAVEPRAEWGKSFMHHLNALADDLTAEVSAREAAYRLCGRKAPEPGFEVALVAGLTPMMDAELVIAWALRERTRITA